MENDEKLRQYLKRVTADLRRTRRRLAQAELRQGEPIAIVGMSCRYPGGIESPQQLWDLVANGRDAISSFPEDRGWELDRLYDPDPDNPGTSYVREGGFVDDVAGFDAAFFGIGPREALAMDPQQRLLLQASWEAFESAGIDPISLRGSDTGVFAGLMEVDYAAGLRASPDRLALEGAGVEAYLGTGSFGSVASGRVAYTLGLEGPTLTVDTACSSSLVALHLAAHALRAEECSLALAGGVTVLSTPALFLEFSRQRVMAENGRSKSFAGAADGTGFSEGIGMLVLERLSDARRNGHKVLAVVRGSAVNQDGASNGLTAPNGPSQERVIRAALASASLSADQVDAVEAHGTGTVLGDPIEAQALLATYGQKRDADSPLRLGSIKSNIGHSQAAAGVAGVIKMVMAMRNGVLPKTLHIDEPSPHVDWTAGAVELLTEPLPWEANGEPRRAGVSSFGISGTNAHVIVEEASPAEVETEAEAEAPDPEAPAEASSEPAVVADGVLAPWLVSARSEGALRGQATRLAARVRADAELSAADVGLSLIGSRSQFERRAVAVGGGRDDLVESLDALARSESAAGLVTGAASPAVAGGGVVLVFPGQGSQWVGMASGLLESSPLFAAELARCDAALAEFVDWSVLDVLAGDGEELERLEVLQTVLFAVMVALAGLWRACGVVPTAVVGHSQGEIAAAYVAGGLSLRDAARTVALRSRVLAKLDGAGAIASIALPVGDVEARIARFDGRLSVASVNGPTAVGVAGDRESLAELLTELDADGVRAREVPGTVPSHSAAVDPLREETAELLADLAPVSGEIPFYSTVTGGLVDTAGLDAGYWFENMRQPVRFDAVTRVLLEQGHRAFVEVSPHPVLAMAVQETIDDALAPDAAADAVVVGTLRRDQGGVERFLSSLAELWVAGVDVDWQALLVGSDAKRVDLPTYAFELERYWLDGALFGSGDMASVGQVTAGHPLLGAAVAVAADDGWLLTGRLSLSSHPWLADHALMDTVLVPGTAFVELALRAGEQVDCEQIDELVLEAPLVLADGGVGLQVAVGERDDDGKREIAIYSRPDSDSDSDDEARDTPWTRHATGKLAPAAELEAVEGSLGEWPPAGAEPVAVDDLYDRFAAFGFEYGPAFQGVRAAWRRDGEVFAEVELSADQRERAHAFGVHPALMDAALQAIAIAFMDDADSSAAPRLPFAWNGVRVHAAGASSLRVRITTDRESGSTSLVAVDASDAVAVAVDSLAVREISSEQLAAARGGAAGGSLFAIDWPEVPAADAPARRVVVLSEPDGPLASALADAGVEAEAHADLGALAAAGEVADGDVVLVDVGLYAGAVLEAAHGAVAHVFGLVRGWLADDRFDRGRLVVVTHGAVAAAAGDDPDLTGAPVWGLVRSAQSEHPGRLGLVDVDGDARSWPALAGALESSEPQLAVRAGKVHAARLVRVEQVEDSTAAPAFDPARSVLITGGTSGIGALVARHLVAAHGVRGLVLASRSGSEADGVAELVADLEGLGARVLVAACDVGDRDQVARLLDSVPEELPLGAVVHSAGVLDDGTIESLDAGRFERVFAPKLDAAWYLHELTAAMDLSAFVMLSSAAGVFGSPGQANYAAANAFLDGLAAHRAAAGRAGTSIAWGRWEQASAMAGALSERDLARMTRAGVAALSEEQGLELFDRSLAGEQALTVALRLDVPALRALARQGDLPPLLRGLIRVPGRRQAAGSGVLAARLAGVPESEREELVLGILRGEVATVLGHASGDAVDPQTAFKDLGFDSLAAVELRNRLVSLSGLQIPATVVFDHPTPAALAGYLTGKVSGAVVKSVAPVARAGGSDEPIAIVGMSCRYPGGVGSPQDLWELLAADGDAISGFPDDRGWDLDRLYDPDPESSGTSYAREGGFVKDAAEFDAAFFGISPREALAMDPQQRLLLEAAWTAIEEAGIDPMRLRGSQTGVFAGMMRADYGAGLGSTPEQLGAAARGLEGYLGTGASASVLSGRVSYTLGLEGPAITIDTACSSSLVALHLACQSLRAGECSLALAGGVSVLATPMLFLEFSRQRGLAPDGRCKSFADAADGAGFSEGVGVLVVERLSDAQRLGHEVLAVVRGSAVNQDGASNGLTAPNGPAQERVILQALAAAGVSAADVDVVEAHGTGTMLGDPIEAQALLATYGQDRDAERPLRLGSVKSNIGHSQAAAGVAGIIKMVLALRNGVLPRTLHVDEPSSHVDWTAGAVELLTEPLPWEANGHPRRAGVSSFGISGTNAHVIVEEAPVAAPATVAEQAEPGEPDSAPAGVGVVADGTVPWALSARSDGALRGQAAQLAEHGAGSDSTPLDVGFALTSSRAIFDRRAVVVGGSDGLLAGTRLVAEGRSGPGVVEGVVSAAVKGAGPVFVFPGQGAQWAGMAAELLEASPVFAAELARCDAALSEYVDWSALDLLASGEGLDRVDVVQPLSFATMVSLAALWRACGVEPAAVVGHSQGEIAAAYVAGGLSLGDAAKVVALRSRALARIAGKGGMASVAATVDAVEARVARFDGRVSIAAVNGPQSVVVSGDGDALDELLAELEADAVRARRIAVDYASHSVHVEEIEAELAELLDGLSPSSGDVPLYSTLTGGLIDTAEMDGGYWYRGLRERVEFDAVTRLLVERGSRAFVEVSTHPVLAMAVQETIDDALEPGGDTVVAGTIRRDEGGLDRFLTSLGELWVKGVEVDWDAIFAGTGASRVALPTYAFDRERYWLAGTALGGGDVLAAGLQSPGHPFLGAALPLAAEDGTILTGRLSLAAHPWLADYAVMGVNLAPGAAFAELALRAGEQVGCEQIEELTIEAPLALSEDDAVELQVVVSAAGDGGRRELSIFARPASSSDDDAEIGWTRHAAGALLPADEAAAEATLSGTWPPVGVEEAGVDGLYDGLSELGFDYGPEFQCLRAAWRGKGEAFAELALSDEQREHAQAFGIHPALLDSALHAVGLVATGDARPDGPWLSSGWSGVRLYATGASVLRVRIAAGAESDRESVTLVVADETGAIVAEVDSVVTREVSRDELAKARGGAVRESLFALDWPEISAAATAAARGRVVVLGEPDGPLASALAGSGVELEAHADLAALADDGGLAGDGDVVLIEVAAGASGADLLAGTRDAAAQTLALLHEWLADDRFGTGRLIFVTRQAIAAIDDDRLDMASAPLWGLVRSAQSEHPGRLGLADVDGPQSFAALRAVLGSEEPQVAVRDGVVHVPRVGRVAVPAQPAAGEVAPSAFDPERSVLVTGGTGGLGALVARHLVADHGVRSVVLASRRGPAADGVEALVAELEGLGARVAVEACDVGDRDRLAQLLAVVPDEFPLGAVIHSAGVLDDGTIESLDAERFDRVFGPKLDAAWHLHELTADLDLSAFVMFSSAAGVFGNPGQANYAAANAFLDALAAERGAAGLPGTSIAWGRWEQASALTGGLTDQDLARMARAGVEGLSNAEGLELFDAAVGGERSLALALRVDLASLRANARHGDLPPLLRGLVKVPTRRQAAGGELAVRLAGVPEEEREAVVLEVLRGELATVLGHASAEAIDPEAAFKDLGFDSLAALELRNRMTALTGQPLPATLIFNYPTPAALAAFLVGQVSPATGSSGGSLEQDLGRLEDALESLAPDAEGRARIASRLRAMVARWEALEDQEDDGVAERIQSATAEELFELMDREWAGGAAGDGIEHQPK